MSLQDFIQHLKKHNQLKILTDYVNPKLEMAEYVDRVSKSKDGGEAVLFLNTGTDFPVLMNMLGSDKRMSTALRVDELSQVGEKVKELLDIMLNPDKYSKIKLLLTLLKMGSIMPKKVARGACQQNRMQHPDLSKLPVIQCWPEDGGPFVTLPVVHTVDPETGKRNVGMYRMQVLDSKTTGMHWHMHKDGASHFQKYKKMGKKMPVAVTLGGDPVYTYAATAPLPKDVDEYLLAGFLRGKAVKLVPCVSQDIRVPADADIVIEGYVDPLEDFVWEGPFGDHTGFYSYADWYPAFHVTAITYKNKAVYPATLVGVPPQEDYYIAQATEKLFLPVIQKTILPELEQMHIPGPGVGHNLTLVSFTKSFPGHAQKVMHALWGAGQMMFNKVLIALDATAHLEDYKEVVKALFTHVDVLQDVHLSTGPLDVLEHASESKAFGGKLFLDATKKKDNPENDLEHNRSQAYDVSSLLSQCAVVKKTRQLKVEDELFPCLFLSIDKQPGDWKKSLMQALEQLQCFPKAIVVVDDVALEMNDYLLVWLLLSNFDPGRDVDLLRIDQDNPTLLLDCTQKDAHAIKHINEWPKVAVSDLKTIQTVDLLAEKRSEPFLKDSPSRVVKQFFRK